MLLEEAEQGRIERGAKGEEGREEREGQSHQLRVLGARGASVECEEEQVLRDRSRGCSEEVTAKDEIKPLSAGRGERRPRSSGRRRWARLTHRPGRLQ